MDCKDLVVEGLGRVYESMPQVLEGLSPQQLAFRPAEHANSIAWLAWHIARAEDDHISELAGRPQAWIEDAWHARFGRAADRHDTGFGHTPEEVASLQPDSADVLLEYHAAVHERSLQYVRQLTCEDMDRVIDRHWDPPVTVGVRLISVVDDTTQHIGQMAYLRGLIENRRWFPY